MLSPDVFFRQKIIELLFRQNSHIQVYPCLVLNVSISSFSLLET